MQNKLPHKKIAVLLLLLCLVQNVYAIPEIQTWQSSNGARVLFVESKSLPIIDIRMVFAAGAARDGDMPGLAMLTNGLMSSGAGDWNADQIAEQLDSVGAVMGNDAARDMGLITLRSLTEPKKLQTAVSVLKQVVANPHFNRRDLERDRQRVLAMLQHKKQLPRSIAEDAFYSEIYASHPYGSPADGTEQSIAKISRQHLRAFHRQYYVANNAVVAVVGGIDRQAAEKLVNELLQALPAGKAASPLEPVAALKAPLERVINMPTTQTQILVGQPGIARGDKDYFALYVGNHILGGSGFSSQLMQIIREDRGLAYDVHSYFLPMAAAGPFLASVQTKNDQAEEARTLLFETIEKFRRQGPTAKELDHAIKNITGGFPMNIDSNSDLVGYLGAIGFYNMPLDHLQTFTDKIRAVTVEQVKDAFQRRLNPASFATVIVGAKTGGE